MLAVCDSMKIVEVPEEGRRCFIFRVGKSREEEDKKKRTKVEIEEKRESANPRVPAWEIK